MKGRCLFFFLSASILQAMPPKVIPNIKPEREKVINTAQMAEKNQRGRSVTAENNEKEAGGGQQNERSEIDDLPITRETTGESSKQIPNISLMSLKQLELKEDSKILINDEESESSMLDEDKFDVENEESESLNLALQVEQSLKLTEQLTTSEKKAIIAVLWREVKENEENLTKLVKKALDASTSEAPSSWKDVLKENQKFRAKLAKLIKYYEREKGIPLYWIQSRWNGEFENVKNKERLFQVKQLHYKAREYEAKTYLIREEMVKEFDKKEDLNEIRKNFWQCMDQSSVAVHTESLLSKEKIEKKNEESMTLAKNKSKFWTKVITVGVNAARKWTDGLASCEQELKQAQVSFKHEWEQELAELKYGESHWYDTLHWYIKEAGRSSWVRLKEVLAQRRIPYIEPAPLQRLSEEEQKSFPGAHVIESKVFSDPENVNNTTVQVRLLITKNTEAPVRVEEIIEPTLGRVERKEMFGDRLLIKSRPGEDQDAFETRLDLPKNSLKRVTDQDLFYQFFFKPLLKETWEECWEKSFEKAKKANADPEPVFF